MTAAPEPPAPDWPALNADLDQLVQDWKTLTEEQRIEKGVAMAMAIVRPQDWRGYVFEPRRTCRTCRTRWQHVDACRAKIVWALQQVAGPIDPSELPPARGGGKEHRENKRRKEVAAMLLGDIMSDFGNYPPAETRTINRGKFSWLVTIAFVVATGEVGKSELNSMVWPAVRRYVREAFDWQWKVPHVHKLKEPPKRSRSGPPAWLREAIDNPLGRRELEEEWFRPRPDSDA